jgi:hypothetical protein
MYDLTEPEKYSVSDSELANWLSEINSQSMVMILDACHSGQMIDRFDNQSGHLSSSEVRALEDLIDETGMYILAGSESEDVSYETSVYGQGLLTYSLLFGMKGEALRDGEYLNVNKLFQYASGKVPQLANSIGGVQKPVVKIPKNMKQIDIGQYNREHKSKINLISPKPVLLASSFQDQDMYLDIINLGNELDEALKNKVRQNNAHFIFLKHTNFNGAYQINGRYAQDSEGLTVSVKIFKNQLSIEQFQISNKSKIELLNELALRTVEIIGADFKKAD